jgi:hypothetical protein
MAEKPKCRREGEDIHREGTQSSDRLDKDSHLVPFDSKGSTLDPNARVV